MSIAMVRVELEGVAPILMHSPTLADPGSYWSKKIREITNVSSKKRTDDQNLQLREFEYMGGMYYDPNIGPYVPDTWIEGVIREGAKKVKRGLASSMVSGTSVNESMIPLEYDGPRDINELYNSSNFIDSRVVTLKPGIKLVRVRPRFNTPWKCSFTINAITEAVSVSDIQKSLTNGGIYCGVGDYKPKFGRFTVTAFEEIKE